MHRLFILTALAVTAPALADESQILLKEAPGKAVVANNCGTCHSLDYIPMNSPFMDQKGWTATVNKMVKVMGAPIKPEDVTPIVDYLAQNYGKK
jgi:cytochrome c5